MSKIALDLDNYKALNKLYKTDPSKFKDILTQTMIHVDNAVQTQRIEYAKDVYKMDYLNMLDDIMETFFDVQPIASKHHNNAEKQGLLGLREDLHPLAIFTNNAAVYNAQGHNVTPSEWIRQGDFNLKDWLYALFYGARFVSWDELATYITLGDYEMMDVLKARNFEQLASIQPALEYQRKHNIPVGKLIQGSGIFDGGDSVTKSLESCPSCRSDKWNVKNDKYSYCPECRLGGFK